MAPQPLSMLPTAQRAVARGSLPRSSAQRGRSARVQLRGGSARLSSFRPERLQRSQGCRDGRQDEDWRRQVVPTGDRPPRSCRSIHRQTVFHAFRFRAPGPIARQGPISPRLSFAGPHQECRGTHARDNANAVRGV